MQFRARGQALLIAGACMTSWVGPQASGPEHADVGALAGAVQGPRLAIGDWNVAPKELASTGWLAIVNGEAVAPSSAECARALCRGRMLDCAAVSRRAWPWISEFAADSQVVEGAGKGHSALNLLLRFDASRAGAWLVRVVRALPRPARPKPKADPASK